MSEFSQLVDDFIDEKTRPKLYLYEQLRELRPDDELIAKQ
jgi:hypothetical protein